MLLRASGENAGLDVDLAVAMDPTKPGDAGVPMGEELLAFASAANQRAEEYAKARDALAVVAGSEGVLEAAATVAVFNGLVRVADGTGIQLDPVILTNSAETRDELGLDEFGGAANSLDAPTELAAEQVNSPSGKGMKAIFAPNS